MTTSNIDCFILYFDGSCQPKNPGGVARYGWHIESGDGVRVAQDAREVCRGAEATNNVAEWAGLRAGLRYLRDQNLRKRLIIRGDSQLVINQLNGMWKCKKAHLKVYLDDCQDILLEWEWKAEWISRSENQIADSLSKESST